MPEYRAYIIEVSDTPPPFANNANHRTVHREAPGAFGIDEYRATAAANLLKLHDNLEQGINRSRDGLAARRAILQQVRIHRDAAMAAPCGTAETAAITALYDELMAEYALGWPTTTTGMVVDGIHLTVRVYLVTDP